MAADSKNKTARLTFPPLPQTARGFGLHLDVTSRGNRLAYTNGNNVVIRSLENAADAVLFNKHAAKANVARFSPNGEMMASGDDSGKVLVWNIKTQEIKKEIPVGQKVLDITWVDEGTKLAAVGDAGGAVKARVFAVDTGNNVGEISGHSKAILSVTASPKRPFKIATSSEDKSVGFHAGPPFHFERSDKNFANYVNCVRYSPDGSKFVAVSSDHKITFFDGASGEATSSIEHKDGHTGSIFSVCWSPDGSQILTASGDRTAKLWNVADSSLATTFTFGDDVSDQQVSCAWLADFVLTVSLSGAINFLDVSNPAQPKRVFKGHQVSVSASTVDASSGAVYTGDINGVVTKWDVKTGDASWFTGAGHGKIILGLAVDATHGILYSAGLDNRVVSSDIKTLAFGDSALALDNAPTSLSASRATGALYAVATSQPKVLLVKEHKIVASVETKYKANSVVISPDDGHVVVGGEDKKVHVYKVDGSALTETHTFSEATGPVTFVTFSADGSILSAGDKDKSALSWDWANQKCLNPLGWKYHTSSVNALAWSPNNVRLVTCSVDRSFIVFPDKNSKLGNPNHKFPLVHAGAVLLVAWLDDSSVVTVGEDRAIKVWDV